MTKRRKILLGCCVFVFLFLVGCAVLLILLDWFVFRHVLHLENRSSHNYFKVDVLWPNGKFDTIWQFNVGDKATLIYHPHTDGEGRLLFYVVTDKGNPRVRYAEPGHYTTSGGGGEEEWIINDDGVETTSIWSGERGKSRLCPILIEESSARNEK